MRGTASPKRPPRTFQRSSPDIRSNMRLRSLSLIPLGVLLALPLTAQIVTDSVPRNRTVPMKETVEAAMERAPWRFGAFRVQPRLGLRNFGYNDNVFGSVEEAAVDDWTATVSAGVDAWLPLGAKAAFRLRALPEYSWYQEVTELRNFGGTYDASLLGFFNRLTLEASAGTADTQDVVNSELFTLAQQQVDSASLRAEVDILRRLSLFGGADLRDRSFEDPVNEVTGLEIARLGREERAVRGGIRYRFRSWFDVSAMVEETSTEFVLDPHLRDNESEALLLGIHYDRPKFFVNLTAGERDGRPANGSSFPAYSEWTGSYFAQYSLTAPVDVEVFGNRDVVYGLFVDNPYFLETRQGVGLRVELGRRLAVRVWGEEGQNDYPVLVSTTGGARERSDDVQTLGASLSIPVWRDLALTIAGTESDYDSSIGGFDRSIVRFTTTLNLRTDVFRTR